MDNHDQRRLRLVDQLLPPNRSKPPSDARAQRERVKARGARLRSSVPMFLWANIDEEHFIPLEAATWQDLQNHLEVLKSKVTLARTEKKSFSTLVDRLRALMEVDPLLSAGEAMKTMGIELSEADQEE